MKKLIIVFVIFVGIVFGQDMIVRVYVPSWEDLKHISEKPLDIAAGRYGEWYDLVVDQTTLQKVIASGLPYEVTVYSLEYEKEKFRGAYLSYTEINDSLRNFALNYPSLVKFDSLPITTYEGRWIYGIKISDNVNLEEDDEPKFTIDGCHHSREWATPQAVLFFADSMLSSYGIVSEITEIINTTEIYCFPLINVDGYVYDYPGQNMWRKNREPFGGGIGADPNRNYGGGCNGEVDGYWGAADENQVSHSPATSSQTFCGAYAYSGDEIQAYTAYIRDHKITTGFSLHSYGEQVMYPWGYKAEGTPDSTLYDTKGAHMASMMQRIGGGTYTPGQSHSNPYPSCGNTRDWVYGYNKWVAGLSSLFYGAEIGTAFYQDTSQLDFISRQVFKAAKYLAGFADSLELIAEGFVAPPVIYPLDTVYQNFTIYWHAKNSFDNHPIQWELVELSNPSVVEDDLESGADRWILEGFTLSTSQSHSSSHSFFSGNQDNMNHAVRTTHPYLVQTGDSITFWCWYNLEQNYDVAVAEISENTKEWFCLDTARFTGNSGGWNRKAYSLDDWVGKSVYFRFRSMTDGNTVGDGFYVDDISPVCLFANVDTISSSVTDTSYYFTNHLVGEFYYYVKGYNTTGGWGDYSCLELVFVSIPPSGPYLVQGSVIVDDAGGNGQANPGEVIDLGVWVENIGVDTAYSVYGLLSESDPYAYMNIDSSWYGNIPEEDSALSSPYFQFTVADTCPNNHTISFSLELHDTNDSIWTSSPSITVYAPILVYQNVGVFNDDNSNGVLDPGETADLVVTISNEGGAVAENVTSTLLTTSPYITINDDSGNFGNIDPATSGNNAGDPYNVFASDTTPFGTEVQFELEVVSGVYVDTFEFSIGVGIKHYYVWNPDWTATPGQNMDSILTALGYNGDYGTSLASNLSLYQAVFVCVGIFSNNYLIASDSPEAAALVDFLENQEGRMYLEGGDVWYYDPLSAGGYDFGPLFGINAVADGSGDLGPVLGEGGTFTNGMDFSYGGENNYIDHINPTGTGFLIFHDEDNAFNCGVANDPGTYRTVGTSFELGLLDDNTSPSTRAELLDSIMNFFGIGLPEEAIPPSAPYITQAEKSGTDVKLTWNTITTDTLGNPETMDCYIVYCNTSPSFVPNSSDSIGAVAHPETTYIDSGALIAGESYYYLVKAADLAQNRSKKSNMGYVLDRFVNYNTDRSSRNWVSLPWHNGYSTVSDLVADLSPAGDPLESVTNLRDDMVEETWLYDTDFMMWSGPNDFTVTPGRGYEMVAIKDTNLVLVGSNDPDGLITLNYNTDRSSRNWVSIPYNAAYSTVDDIAQEYSPAGDPLESISNLRDDMVVETWLWDTDFMMWYGPNDFAIEPGRGYEFVPIKDTTWNPNEYSNEAFGQMLAATGVKRSDVEVYEGLFLEPDRVPKWIVKELDKRIDYSDAKNYKLNTERLDKKADYREPGVSHIVRVHLNVKKFDNLVFTAYRPEQPYDVLTENMIGSCVAIKGDQAAFFFNVGNFKRPWQDKEEVIIIIEALNQGRGYFTVVNLFLDERVDVQDVDNITLMPIPEPVIVKGSISWHRNNNDNIVGYSLYKDDKRLNNMVIAREAYPTSGEVNVRPVIRGGYETVYGSQGLQSTPDIPIPIKYAFNIFPNPFVAQTRIEYALPRQASVEIAIYDATGRQVKTLVSEKLDPGYYQVNWLGNDNMGRKVSAGVYFIRMNTKEHNSYQKVIFVH